MNVVVAVGVAVELLVGSERKTSKKVELMWRRSMVHSSRRSLGRRGSSPTFFTTNSRFTQTRTQTQTQTQAESLPSLSKFRCRCPSES